MIMQSVAESQLMPISANPTCDGTQAPFHRRSPGDSTRTPESHQATEPSNNETIEGALIAARDPAIDPKILHYLAYEMLYILTKFYINGVDKKFGYLDGVDLAKAEAVARFLQDIWGGVSLAAWSARVHYIIQANTASDPLDPLAQVEAMICEGSSAKAITDGILLFSKTVCMNNECGVTPSTCSPHSTRGNLDDMRTLINDDEENNGRSELLRRGFTLVKNIRLSEFTTLP